MLFGAVFACGSLVRIFLKYSAADLSLEGALVSGLVGGYVPGLVAGMLVALPGFLIPPLVWTRTVDLTCEGR